MKTTLIAIACMLLAIGQVAPVLAQDTESKDKPDIITIYVKMKVEGMSCLECSERLKKKLENTDNISNVKVYLQAQIAVFTMPSNKVLSEKEIRKLVIRAGFTLIWVKFDKEEFEKELDENDII